MQQFAMRLRQEESGASMAFVAVFILAVILMCGIAIEVSRALIEREKLKTATEAAVLAGALQADPWIYITVHQSRYECTTTRGPDGHPVQVCGFEYRDVPLHGKETHVVPSWRQLAGCGDGWDCTRPPTINCRGVHYPGNTQQIMHQTFSQNVSMASDVDTTLLTSWTQDRDGTTYVEAIGRLRVQLMRLAGAQEIPFRQWSQGKAQPRPIAGWNVGKCW